MLKLGVGRVPPPSSSLLRVASRGLPAVWGLGVGGWGLGVGVWGLCSSAYLHYRSSLHPRLAHRRIRRTGSFPELILPRFYILQIQYHPLPVRVRPPFKLFGPLSRFIHHARFTLLQV